MKYTIWVTLSKISLAWKAKKNHEVTEHALES